MSETNSIVGLKDIFEPIKSLISGAFGDIPVKDICLVLSPTAKFKVPDVGMKSKNSLALLGASTVLKSTFNGAFHM